MIYSNLLLFLYTPPEKDWCDILCLWNPPKEHSYALQYNDWNISLFFSFLLVDGVKDDTFEKKNISLLTHSESEYDNDKIFLLYTVQYRS
jgi:hypothetical protein